MPDTTTEIAIATTTLTTTTATITFSSIPSTYTDLRLVFFQAGSTTIYGRPNMRFNSDSGTNYSSITIVGDGAGASSANWQTESSIRPSNYYLGSGVAFVTYDIFSYSGTSTYKTTLGTQSADQNGTGSVTATTGLWKSTSAINSITLIHPSGSPDGYSAGTTVTLYGIL
jgi:hypothetical protein